MATSRATGIFHLSEDLQISIIDRAISPITSAPWTLKEYSLVCKLWRRLIWNRLDWPHLTLHLTTEELGPEQKAANELFLTWFDQKWKGLKSLKIAEQATDRSLQRPTFTAKEIAKLLPRAAHLTRVGFIVHEQKVGQLLAEDTTFNWFQNAHELRSVEIWGIDKRVERYLQHLPLCLETASLWLSRTLTTFGLACLNLPTSLKSLNLSSGGKDRFGEEDLKGLASLTNLESLSIQDAALYALPTWLPKLPALQSLSLGFLIGAAQHTTHETTDRLEFRVEALAHLKRIKNLHFSGTLPQDIGALRNLETLYLDTDVQEIDLGVLRPCSKLRLVVIKPSWIIIQAKPTLIRGLETLSGLRNFYCRASRDMTVDLQVGASSIEHFWAWCGGRFLFTGQTEAFTQFCCKLQYLRVEFLQPQDVSDCEQDASFHPLSLAAEQRGLKAEIQDVSESESSARHGYKERELVIKSVNS